MRLSVLKEEIMSNVPKYKSDPNYLYIHIRSGDIFIKNINPNYSQPPLCFYQKIINENNFTNIFLLSNGHENPCVDTLLKLYQNIKFIHGSVEEAVSIIINIYNLVISFSTFILSLINLNDNLHNLYIYNIIDYKITKTNLAKHVMPPSSKYEKIVKGK